MSGNQTIFKNTILLYIRQIFVLLLSLYTSRLTLQALGEVDFGIYAAVGGITALLSVITSSLSSSTQRFMTFELGTGSIDAMKKVYNNSLYIYLSLCFVLLILGESLGSWFIFHKLNVPSDRLMAAFYIFQFSLASSIVSLTNIPNSAAIVAHEDMGVYAVFSIVDAVLRVTFVGLLFVVSCDKLLFYAGALLVIQIVSRLISEVWCRLRYEECCLSRNFDWGVMRSMLGISGWSGLSNISYTIFIQGVNLLINLFFGPVMNAAYGVAMQVYSGIRSFTSSFQLASNPQIVKLYSVGETDRMCRLVFSTCRMSFYLIFCLSLPFLINAHYVLDLWLDEVPTHTESFFRLFLFYAYIDVLAYPLNVAAQATGILGRYTTLTSIAVLAILPIAYVCYCCGAVAEVVYVIAIIVSVLSLFIRIFCLNRIMGFPVMAFVREVLFRMLCVVALASILPLLNHCLTTTTTLWNVIINFIIAFISGCTVVYIVGLNQQEQNFLRGYFLRLIQKFRKL